jgi:hypothetical protein
VPPPTSPVPGALGTEAAAAAAAAVAAKAAASQAMRRPTSSRWTARRVSKSGEARRADCGGGALSFREHS